MKRFEDSDIFFTIIACMITGIFVFFYTNLGYKSDKYSDIKTKSKIDNITSNANSNAVDKDVSEEEKRQINEIMTLLFSNPKIENNNIISGINYNANIFDNFSYGNSEKLSVALYTIPSDEYLTYKSTNGKFLTAEQKENILIAIKNNNGTIAVNIDKVNHAYKKIFGVLPTSYDVIKGCPNWYYDSLNKQYVGFIGCGAMTVSKAYVYLDSYTKEKDNIVLSTYVAINSGEYADTEAGNFAIYKDVDTTTANIYKKGTAADIEKFRIDENNKKDFTKYNFIFAKNKEGQYYLSKVKKIF